MKNITLRNAIANGKRHIKKYVDNDSRYSIEDLIDGLEYQYSLNEEEKQVLTDKLVRYEEKYTEVIDIDVLIEKFNNR